MGTVAASHTSHSHAYCLLVSSRVLLGKIKATRCMTVPATPHGSWSGVSPHFQPWEVGDGSGIASATPFVFVSHGDHHKTFVSQS